jgi:hypothetical protein
VFFDWDIAQAGLAQECASTLSSWRSTRAARLQEYDLSRNTSVDEKGETALSATSPLM